MGSKYYHSLPRTFAATPEDRKEYSQVEKRISFINRTHREVVICERSNFKIALPPVPTFGKEHEIIIRIEYFIHTEKVKNNTELLLDRLALIGDHLKIYRNAFTCNSNRSQFGGVSFVVEYPVKHSVLEDYGGSVYYKEIDTVISLYSKDHCPDHPFSYEAEMSGSSTTDDGGEQPNFGLNLDIYINDPHNRYGERYVNLFGKVYCVRTTKLFDRREGIYLSKTINGKAHSSYYAFDDENKEISLFRVEDDALTNGHVEILLKRNLAELENNNLVLKKQLDETKLQMQARELEIAASKMELEKEKEEWKAKKERDDIERKMEYERMRDWYEKRSYERKDNNELLKYIPTLCVGIGSIMLALKNLLKDDK